VRSQCVTPLARARLGAYRKLSARLRGGEPSG
jgi:hypothetical protein